ncbi:MAG: pyridoxal phosphate-dependent aminotransferase, partial [Thermoplasmata archaeon]
VEGVTVPVHPSWANMTILDISATGLSPETIQEEMLKTHGVFVRSGNYLSPTHGGKFVRVSFSNPPGDLDKFATAFPETLRTLRARPAPPPAA